MVSATLLIRRRTRIEQKVLGYLRNPAPAALTEDQRLCFARLRDVAAVRGLSVQAPGTPYLSEGERLLLAWLAQAQRVVGPKPHDKILADAVICCAEVLRATKVKLPPLSLYNAVRA